MHNSISARYPSYLPLLSELANLSDTGSTHLLELHAGDGLQALVQVTQLRQVHVAHVAELEVGDASVAAATADRTA